MVGDSLAKTLTTGATGALGSYIDFGTRLGGEDLDITDLDRVRTVFHETRPATVLHLAATTDLLACEADPSRAYFVNGVGTYHVALACREIGARLVYVSTAGVFSGTKVGPYAENDTPDPPNMYGRSKYAGELAVRGLLKDHLIVRTCWVFGGGPQKDKKFIGKIAARFADPLAKEIRATDDEIGSPTYGKDLAFALRTLIEHRERGTVHVANAGAASRYDVARVAAEVFAAQIPIVPVPLSVFDPGVPLTMNQELSSRLRPLRPWQDALREYIKTEWTSVS